MKLRFRTDRHAYRHMHWAFGLLLTLALCFAPTARAEDPSAAPPPPRTVAIGDVHGDFDAFAALLQHAGLIDSKMQWTGGTATLVQVGDFLDRGKKCRTVMDLLMALERQAPKKGGRVVVLAGNHEMMNITGDLRYAQEMYASFATENSEKRRLAAWEKYKDWQAARATALGRTPPVVTPEAQDAWMKAHPAGFFEQREAMARDGKYGRWLRQRPALFVQDGTLFLHGGVSPEFIGQKLDDIAARIKNEMNAFDSLQQYLADQKIILPFFTLEEMTLAVQDELAARQQAFAEKEQKAAAAGKKYEASDLEKRQAEILDQFLGYPGWYSINPSGPLWFRGYATWTDAEGDASTTKLLQAFGLQRIVVGHTPVRGGRIASRFGNRIFLIDTGMLASYYPGGRGSALELSAGRITAIYMDSRVVLLEPGGANATGAPANREAPAQGDAEDIPGGGVQQQAAAPPSAQNPPAEAAAKAPESKPNPNGIANTRPPFAWLDAAGNPLPFKSEAELLEFLRTAKVVQTKDIGTGITHPRKLTLEKDGIRAHAIFRTINEEKDIAKMPDGRMEMGFRDYHGFEVAAYELSRLMGLDWVPPATHRRLFGDSGTVQVWLEGAMMETDRQKNKIKPPNVIEWNRRMQILRIFDNIVYNIDRNMGNILIDKEWRVWLIDHSRAFRRHNTLRDPETVVGCDRKFWESLQNFNEAEARTRLRPYLRGIEIDSLFDRRRKMVEFLRKQIAAKGESEFLFDLE